MRIEVMGSGCRNCEMLYQNVLDAVETAGLTGQVDIAKIKDPNEFVAKGVFTTPGLSIDGKVVSTGRVPSSEQIGEMMSEALTKDNQAG